VTLFAGAVDEALVESLIGRHVRRHNPQHIVDIPCHAINVHDLRHRCDRLAEAIHPFRRMISRFDRDKDGKSEPDFLRRKQCDAPRDDARGLELSDALPARGLRQMNAFGDLGDGDGGVLLQKREYLAVDGVHARYAGCGRRIFLDKSCIK
jgi:hypothetical protein